MKLSRLAFFDGTSPVADTNLRTLPESMLLIRYAPIRGWYKASGCCTLLALYHAATPAVVERILALSGEEMGRPLAKFPWFTFQPGDWSTPWAIGNNVNALISLGLLVLAAAYRVIGATRRRG